MQQIVKSTDDIAEFYDAFGKRLIRDYVHGNARVSKAVDRVCSVIKETGSRILDIGCGIGTSASIYKQRCPGVAVHGVDISPQNISIANSLFGQSGINFSVSAMENPPSEESFDVVAMIDVYEHIPRTKWSSFNKTISGCLAPDGVFVMTTPSPLHQAYLAENKPDGLQIVDECVELADVLALQEDLKGCLTCYSFVSVWNTNDYLHVVIDRNPQYTPIRRQFAPHRSLWQKLRGRLVNERRQAVQKRRNHVKEVLGIDVP